METIQPGAPLAPTPNESSEALINFVSEEDLMNSPQDFASKHGFPVAAWVNVCSNLGANNIKLLEFSILADLQYEAECCSMTAFEIHQLVATRAHVIARNHGHYDLDSLPSLHPSPEEFAMLRDKNSISDTVSSEIQSAEHVTDESQIIRNVSRQTTEYHEAATETATAHQDTRREQTHSRLSTSSISSSSSSSSSSTIDDVSTSSSPKNALQSFFGWLKEKVQVLVQPTSHWEWLSDTGLQAYHDKDSIRIEKAYQDFLQDSSLSQVQISTSIGDLIIDFNAQTQAFAATPARRRRIERLPAWIDR